MMDDLSNLIYSRLSGLFLVPLVILTLLIPQIASSDLDSDRQSLLAFANSVPHVRKLNWNASSSVCSWFGVTCASNGSRVIALRLPGTGLYGPIPANTLGKLDALRILSLRSNFLSGSIPADISNMTSLENLSVQNNNLSGNLPISLPSSLVIINLSSNSFSGQIPDLKLPNLKHFDISNNNLNGSIPNSLQKFPSTSFAGNSLLCGTPLPPCSRFFLSPSSSPLQSSPAVPARSSTNNLSTGVIIAIAAGTLTILMLLALFVLVCMLRRKSNQGNGVRSKVKSSNGGRIEKPVEKSSSGAREAEKNKLVFFEGCSYNFDLEDLLRASAEVLGKGSYGTAYKAVLEDGTLVVVKRIKDVTVGKREFEQQMEIVGKVGKHPNVLPLRAYYHSKDEKLLVFDHVPTGSFAFLLHANRDSGRTPLNWESRVKIALGSARGLAHIHKEGGSKFTHGNIKSSNILLTQEMDARVTDFGLAPLMNFPAIPRNMVGYRAPELIETGKSSQKSDVYSFGVLLLELLTGKAAVPSIGSDEILDLPRWVQSVVREEWTAEVFDAELMNNTKIEDEMVHMLQIAMACVVKSPDQRPKMDDVVRMIIDLRHPDSENRLSSEDRSKDSTLVASPSPSPSPHEET